MDKSRYVLGGSTWINLLNTTYTDDKHSVDILLDPAETFQWLEENNLLRNSDVLVIEDKERLDQLIEELHSLRQFCKVLLSDLKQQGELSPNTIERLETLVQQVKVNLSIVQRDNKLNMISEGLTAKDHVSYIILSSIIHTLNNFSIDRIRECEHHECILHFVDTSKSGKRRWCSMELCGNRQKAAEFYARKKSKRI
ncbi:CGNR zinc finger domain-containing protein [Ureibacillus aquaedulcis]|uniref:CGNR zinc finger domain-containing protein n=1 Tax=Ureibacillus aquaedulcis TaxID=3058421 RepID=A0ABT8GST0_9BACL|nr:CGNR zinc finger domain-containing protein [Ureibacillus sp. BA0131]MDN4494475.1 CGNR zinc finger domain-containing protein [Ureibacillus sp. BA0131]